MLGNTVILGELMKKPALYHLLEVGMLWVQESWRHL